MCRFDAFRDKSAKQRERERERERLTEIGTAIERQRPNHVLENYCRPCVLMSPGLFEEIGRSWKNFLKKIDVKAFVLNLLCGLFVSKAFWYAVHALEEI